MSWQWVIQLVHTTKAGEVYTAFHGPYVSLGEACEQADYLTDWYAREPMRLDGEPCTTVVTTSTLAPPLRNVPLPEAVR